MLSLCVINKNDEGNLAYLLNSARPHFDEIVVVDTGSIDRSLNVARAYADVVVPAGDRLNRGDGYFSFSEARQLSFDVANGDWLMWLDTDDDLSDWRNLQHVVSYLEKKKNKGNNCYAELVYDYSWNSTRTRCLQSFYRERIVHKDYGCKWVKPVHEHLEISEDVCRISVPHDVLRVIHRSQGARERGNKRNLKILLKELERNPDQAWLHFYLSEELHCENDEQKSIYHIDKYISLVSSDVEKHSTMFKRGIWFKAVKSSSYDEGIKFLEEHSNLSVPAHTLLNSYFHLKLGDRERAKSLYELALTQPIFPGLDCQVIEDLVKNNL